MTDIRWTEDGLEQAAHWLAAGGSPPPRRVQVADDRLPATTAYRLACEGTAVLWRGGYPAARRLLRAMARRADRTPVPTGPTPADTFHAYRRSRAHRARVLGALLVPLAPDGRVPLKDAPEVRQACAEVYGPPGGRDAVAVVALRELLGVIGAHEWRVKGVEIPALGGDRVHPHYGVFSPTRAEYVDLVAAAPLPRHTPVATAFDVGTGTGVLAALLARRGAARVVATDVSPRAVACARDNFDRLGLAARVSVHETDLFPEGRATLVVCNPPWVPAHPASPLDAAVYDRGGRMLRGFLHGLAAHLEPAGEGWLVLSDLAEHLGLRSREELLTGIDAAGLRVLDRLDARPAHPRARDTADPLHPARAAETTSLWRLAPR